MAGRTSSPRLGMSLELLENRSLPSVSATLGSLGVLRINGAAGADDITVRQADGAIWIDGTDIVSGGAPQSSVPAESVRRIVINSFGSDDIIFLSAAGQEVGVPTVVNAGGGHDWVYTGTANDVINGGYGNDSLFASTGTDAVYGQPGSDFLDDGDRDPSLVQVVAGGLGMDWNADVVAIQGTKGADVKQRGSPTCSFLASLSALARREYDFREWISYDGVNEVGAPVYSVAFWNGADWTWQSVVFDGKRTSSDAAPAVEGESWVILMNRAWTAYHGPDGSAFPHEALLALTALEATYTEHWDTLMGAPEFNRILDTIDRGGVVIAGTAPQEYMGTLILIPDHAYSVLQVFELNGTVWLQLRNPMGFDGGEITSGNTLDGIVYVTWDEFAQSTTYLATLTF